MNQKLIDAARDGNLAEVKTLMAQGADVHAWNDDALRLAAEYGHLAVVEWLVGAGADVHARNDAALRWAANHGHLAVVEWLVGAGADVHARNDLALRWAAMNGHLAVVEFLENYSPSTQVAQATSVPANNDGRTTCCKCHAPTKKVPGFDSMMDVCTGCGY